MQNIHYILDDIILKYTNCVGLCDKNVNSMISFG